MDIDSKSKINKEQKNCDREFPKNSRGKAEKKSLELNNRRDLMPPPKLLLVCPGVTRVEETWELRLGGGKDDSSNEFYRDNILRKGMQASHLVKEMEKQTL